MAQQTAVEWLSDNLIGNPYTQEDFIHNVSVFKQAKQMEKEQIMNAWRNGDNDSMYDQKELDNQAKQYYNETYGSNNQI